MNQDHAKSRCALFVATTVALVLVLPASQAGAVKRAFFGTVPAETPSAAEFGSMGDARVGTYRFPLDWSQIQPTQGTPPDWSAIDAQVENAALNGIEILPIAYGSPGFAAGDRREPPLGSRQAKQAWKDFLEAVVERYGRGGDFWSDFEPEHPGVKPRPLTWLQVWNEQNSPTFYVPKPSPKEYAKLLKISNRALAGTDVDIVLGGMFGTPRRNKGIYSWKFLKRLYKVKRAKKLFDAVALHPYSPNLEGIKAQIRLVRKQMKKANDRNTPIWISEIGWGSAGTKGQPLAKSETGQRKMLRKSFNLILDRKGKWKVRRVLWFAWRDPDTDEDVVGGVCHWCGSAGLHDVDLAPKPALGQYRKFTGAA
ncbi:MAG TPA: glycosyl hydrolase [Solirubrobacterales bacterium]|nr:glycosyl hydrolase [Solirubrobacterales bacterium]